MNIDSRQYICPDWPAPVNIKAYTTTRQSGCSLSPFNSFNLASHVGDREADVIQNRRLLKQDLELSYEPAWLNQTHSTDVVNLESHLNGEPSGIDFSADASYTSKGFQVATIMTADCLPLLVTNRQGTWVAAIHAGWRGLLNGIVENTLAKYTGNLSDLMLWMGPAISAEKFEVGAEVRQLFGESNPEFLKAFELVNGLTLSNKSSKTGRVNEKKYLCDLYSICRKRAEVHDIKVYGGNFCTYSDSNQFFSYRRDGQTGRMASLIWIENSNSSKG